MFVVGGSGVTFALSVVQDLLLVGDRSRAKVIDVIWSITDPGLSFVRLCVSSPSG
jgi:ferric-chelate reductase